MKVENVEGGSEVNSRQGSRLYQIQPARLRAAGNIEKARSFPPSRQQSILRLPSFSDPAFFSAHPNPTNIFLPTPYSSFQRRLRIQRSHERTPYSTTREGNTANDSNNNSFSESLPFEGAMRFTLSPFILIAA